MGAEAEIERTICSEAREAGWKAWKLAFPGTNGAPDHIFGKGGRSILIEFKATGERPTKQQYKRHQELREDFGLEVRWADSLEGGRRILNL